jgi:uncharacterized protein with HEPN domain
MRPEDRDAAYLWDIVDAAKTIVEFTKGANLGSFLIDRKLQAAVEREIEIIGEAARKISEAFKSRHPGVPWRAMIAQRNVLAHEYGEVQQERIWVLAAERIPELILQIEPLMPPEPKG